MHLRILWATTMVALVLAASAVPASGQADETYPLSPYIQVVGDLDGDGLRDLVSLSGRTEEPTEEPAPRQVTAYRGSDGGILWSTEVPAWVNRARAARVGANGAQGLILDGYLFTRATLVVGAGGYESPYGSFLTGAAALMTGVVAVSGSGSAIWTRTFEDQSFLYPPETNIAHADGLALFTGMLGATATAADDVLISVYDRAPAADGQEDTFTGIVLDGADGSTASMATLDVDSAVTTVIPAGDLSGDGLEDYTVGLDPYTDENDLSVVAIDGSTGQHIWTLPFGSDDLPGQTKLGDVTGDGADDLAFVSQEPATFDPLGDEVRIVDGPTGTVESILTGDLVRSAPDLSGDGTRDVLVAYRQQVADSVAVIYEVFRADGHIVRHRLYEIPRSGSQDSVTAQLRASVGDVDGDGIADLAHAISTNSGSSDSRVLSGRDGSSIRAGTVDGPLFASVDGIGDDVAKVTIVSQRHRDVAVSDGLTGDLIWKVRLEARGEELGGFQLTAADVTGDGRAEVIAISSSNTTGTELPQGIDLDNEIFRDIWVLDGRDGSVLWKPA